MTERPLYVGPLIHLRTLPAFEALTPEQLRDLAYEAEEVVLERGSFLIRAGEPAPALYLIVDGLVARGSDDVVGPGGVVGFLEVLASGPAPAQARANTDVVALRLGTDSLRAVCEQNFAVLSALLTHVAGRVTESPAALSRSMRVHAEGDTTEVLDRVGRILALHRTPTFSSHSMDALAELAGHLEGARAEAGTVLWHADEPATRFLLVCSGAVRMSAPDWSEPLQVRAGGAPGLVETIAGRPHGCEAVAIEPTVLLQVGVEPFMDVIEDHFEMAFGLLGRLAGYLVESGSDPPPPGE